MKRRSRVHASRKTVRSRSSSRRRGTPKHLRFHMLFVYSTMVIFGLTLTLAVVQKTFEPFNFNSQPSTQYVLGESVSQSPAPQAEEEPFYKKIFDLFLP